MIRKIVFSRPDGESSPRGTLIEWFVEEGKAVAANDALCSFEIDKAIETFYADASFFLRRILVPAGARIAVGQELAVVSDSPDEEITDAASEGSAATVSGDGGFDWSEIDVRDGDPQPLDVMRRTIADRMAMSKRFIPCFYLTSVVDMSACVELRAALKKDGKKATFNDMAIRASALALARHPGVRGVFVPEGFQPRDRINVGFAAALPGDGLVVPVIKDADQKPLAEIAVETRELAKRARNGELRPEDCSGGIFSVSYLGSFEVDEFIAIVNPGEAAILAVGKLQKKPVVIDDGIGIAPLMKITLSCDHRSIDGALAARFAGDIKALLEKPDQL